MEQSINHIFLCINLIFYPYIARVNGPILYSYFPRVSGPILYLYFPTVYGPIFYPYIASVFWYDLIYIYC